MAINVPHNTEAIAGKEPVRPTWYRFFVDLQRHVAGLVTGVSSVFGRTGAVVSASGDYTASQVTNVPAGNIAATTVQAAINELDSEKVATATFAEAVSDQVGTMVTGNTETNITVTYQDSDNTLDFAVPAADDSTAGVIEIATGAEVETGTDTTRAVSPGRQERHASACKAWAKVTNLSTTPTKAASYNCGTLTDNGTGDITVDWTTDMSSGDYDIQVTVRNTGGSPRIGVVTADAVGSARVLIQNSTNGAAVDNDFYIAAHGDQ